MPTIFCTSIYLIGRKHSLKLIFSRYNCSLEDIQQIKRSVKRIRRNIFWQFQKKIVPANNNDALQQDRRGHIGFSVRATSAEHSMCQSRACCKDIIVGSLQFITEDMKKTREIAVLQLIKQTGPYWSIQSGFSGPYWSIRSCLLNKHFHEKFVWEIMD